MVELEADEIKKYGCTLEELKQEVHRSMEGSVFGPQHYAIYLLGQVELYGYQQQTKQIAMQLMARAVWVLHNMHIFKRPFSMLVPPHIREIYTLAAEYERHDNQSMAFILREAAVALETQERKQAHVKKPSDE